jgi:electron transfer flavoprotein beta subunit
MRIAVCWKWVSLDRDHDDDERWSGVSAADEAALEVALLIADRSPQGRGGHEVVVWCLGPAGADASLRNAIAAGADEARRIDASTDLDGRVVAEAIASHVAGADLVICGDYSIDRGTGSVPAYLAAELGAAQALGLVEIDVDGRELADGRHGFRVVRRLDAGRREVLDIAPPAVLSVEGSNARLRRAALAAELVARDAVIPSTPGPHGRLAETEIHPYRPRPRTLPAPAGDLMARVRSILDVGGTDAQAETVTLEPGAAAARILDQLTEWGYLGEHVDDGSG